MSLESKNVLNNVKMSFVYVQMKRFVFSYLIYTNTKLKEKHRGSFDVYRFRLGGDLKHVHFSLDPLGFLVMTLPYIPKYRTVAIPSILHQARNQSIVTLYSRFGRGLFHSKVTNKSKDCMVKSRRKHADLN